MLLRAHVLEVVLQARVTRAVAVVVRRRAQPWVLPSLSSP